MPTQTGSLDLKGLKQTYNKTIAVVQPIYCRTDSSTAPADSTRPTTVKIIKTDDTGTTAPSSNGDGWTTMLMARICSSNVNYKFLWTCQQLLAADGTVLGCTSIVEDKGTTIIDGDTVTTGTVNVGRLNVADVITAINNNGTTTINGGKITTGTLSANSINANSGTFDTALIPQLTISKIDTLQTTLDRKAASGAENTALSYLSYDTTNGLRIARSSPSTATSNLIQITAGNNPIINIIKDSTNKAAIDADGMKVYKGDASNPVAQFGTIFYVGRNKEFYLDSQNMQFLTPSGNGLGFECRNIEGETSTSVTEQILNSYICDGTETVVKLSGISFLSEYDNTNTFYKYNDVVKYFNSSTAIFYGGDAPKEIIAEISSAAVSGFSDGDEIIFYQQYPASTTIYYPYMSLLSKRSNGGIGQYSLTVGLNNVASGYISYAEGNDTRALGYISHAEGYKTTTGTVSLGGGKYAHAEGNETIAYADSSHVEGYKTIAGVSGQSKGAYSHAEGSYTITTGNSSHAEGSNTQAISYCAHAEGGETIAGNTSTINGWYAHAEGYLTVASGGSAHSEGSQSIASGSDSHAQNFYTIASKAAQTALGTLNIEDTSTTTTHPSGDTDYGQYAVIIGNGTSDLNKSNALTVAWNGNLWTAGNIRATTESTTITIPAANKFTVYTGSPYTTNTNIKLRRFGNVVTITGMVKPKETIAGSDNEYTICSIPTAYSSWCPPQVIVQIMQGSAQYKWCLKINTSGTVTFSRYSGTTSYAQVTTSTWLPFHATWIVDS